MRKKEFDARRAIWLAAVCGQTYRQYSNPDGSFVVPEGFAVAAAFDAASLNRVPEPFGFILESKDEIVVAFRGTSSTSDWLSDALATQQEYPFATNAGMTHRGFTQIYQSARDPIVQTLARLGKSKRLSVTGHSLGGALAALCALDVAANAGFRSPALYTFGSPRVGNPAFVRAFRDRLGDAYRISNLYDAVTYLPPTTIRVPRTDKVFEYRHIRTLVTLEFQNGSVSANHMIGGYFAALAKREPGYAKALCEANPGFCPSGAGNLTLY